MSSTPSVGLIAACYMCCRSGEGLRHPFTLPSHPPTTPHPTPGTLFVASSQSVNVLTTDCQLLAGSDSSRSVRTVLRGKKEFNFL
ncbi:hypothetical protein J6590_049613 [Homalodisca vitripennis]|nr:hypothetical protein J6590_049613 [Homalodisca vitripennis]